MKNLLYRNILPLILVLTIGSRVHAQDDLEKLMAEENNAPKREPVTASFKGTRLMNFHTLETLGPKTLEFIISHRFGDINSGPNNLWGLEGPATIRFALEYGISRRLMVGLGRSSAGKLIDGFMKYRVLRQTTDNRMPISITAIGSVNLTTQNTLINSDALGPETYPYFTNRLSYMAQLIIGRKFSQAFSFQVSPTYIHYNLVPQIMDRNDIYAVIVAGRCKLSKRFALTGEYAFRINNYSPDYKNFHNSASLGVDIETGGHVFQLFLANSFAINEVLVIPYTNTTWKNGGIRLGFNITRSFAPGRKKKKNKE